ncbi:MAG TPA: hypothetical protein VNT12_00130 [Rubrobacter sp.]|jgi:hypothetical protein|nr:hypothetical protein [Rubrobacter sp.]
MTEPVRDQWAEWLLERRFGGDSGQRERMLEGLISGESLGLELLLKSSGNPKIPTLEEAMNEALTPEEIEHFTTHLRPLVERNESKGMSAVAYLWAVKQEG